MEPNLSKVYKEQCVLYTRHPIHTHENEVFSLDILASQTRWQTLRELVRFFGIGHYQCV
jgi:hypothetical protein